MLAFYLSDDGHGNLIGLGAYGTTLYDRGIITITLLASPVVTGLISAAFTIDA